MNSSIPPTCCICGGRSWRTDLATTRVIRTAFESGQVNRCLSCGHGVLWPAPTPEVIAGVYASPEYVSSYDNAGEAFVINEETCEQQLQPRFERIERSVPGKGTLLDVGASRGFFLKVARDRGWKVHGIEAGLDAIAYARSNFQLEIQHGSLESIAFEPNTFDCIHMSHVLEHLLEPAECIRKLGEAMRRGGMLVVEVPFEFGDLFDVFRERLLGRPREPYPVRSTHLHFFTLRTLVRLLQQSGFEIVYAATPRRNQSYDSRLPLGTAVKSLVYRLEATLQRGPLLEVYARKP